MFKSPIIYFIILVSFCIFYTQKGFSYKIRNVKGLNQIHVEGPTSGKSLILTLNGGIFGFSASEETDDDLIIIKVGESSPGHVWYLGNGLFYMFSFTYGIPDLAAATFEVIINTANVEDNQERIRFNRLTVEQRKHLAGQLLKMGISREQLKKYGFVLPAVEDGAPSLADGAVAIAPGVVVDSAALPENQELQVNIIPLDGQVVGEVEEWEYEMIEFPNMFRRFCHRLNESCRALFYK